MKLTIDIPHGWTTTLDRGWTTSVSFDRTLRLVVAPLIEREHADLRRVLARAVPPGARIEEVSRQSGVHSHAGWEMSVITVRVVDGTGTELERRRVAVYQVLWLVGAVMIVGRGEDLERERELLENLLPSGRPLLSTQEPSCVSDWFQLEAS